MAGLPLGSLACGPEPTVTSAPVVPTPTVEPTPATTTERELVSEILIGEGKSDYNHVQVTQEGQLRRMYFISADGRRLLQSTYDLAKPDTLDHEVFQTMISALIVSVGRTVPPR